MRERREGKKGESFCVVVVRTEKEEEECWVSPVLRSSKNVGTYLHSWRVDAGKYT